MIMSSKAEGQIMAVANSQRWAGNGYMPGYIGMWGLSGLVVLEISESRVTYRTRPRLLGKIIGAAPLVAGPDDGLTISTEPVRRGWGYYIKFTQPGKRPYLFRVTAAVREEVLTSLSEAGFET